MHFGTDFFLSRNRDQFFLSRD